MCKIVLEALRSRMLASEDALRRLARAFMKRHGLAELVERGPDPMFLGETLAQGRAKLQRANIFGSEVTFCFVAARPPS